MVDNNNDGLEDLASQLEVVLAIQISRTRLLDVICLIDGSGSITQQQWCLIRSSLEELVDRIPLSPSKRFGIIQFSDITRREVEFCSDKDAAKELIRNMLQLKNGTKTAAGLKACESMFAETGQKDASQLIILLTDGQSEDKPLEVADRLKKRNPKPTLIVIGIGNQVNQAEIDAIATSPQHSFKLDRMDNLNKFFTLVAVKAGEKPEVSVTNCRSDRIILRLRCDNTMIRKYEIHCFENNSFRKFGETVVAQPGRDCEYTIDNLTPNTKFLLKVIGITQDGVHTVASDVLECASLPETRHAYRVKHGCSAINEEMRIFLTTWRPPKGCGLNIARIGLFGRIGSGKSESINELVTAIYQTRLKPANSDNSTHSVTKIIRDYLKNLGFSATDSWGWQNDVAQYESVLMWILNGALKEGTSEGQDITKHKNGTLKNNGVPIVGVVLFIPLFSYDNPPELEKFVQIRHGIKQLGKSTVTVLTKADQVDPELKRHPELIFESGLVENAKREFKERTGIPEEEIFLMTARVNGEVDEQRKQVHDYLIMLPFVYLIKTGIQYCLDEMAGTFVPADSNNNNNEDTSTVPEEPTVTVTPPTSPSKNAPSSPLPAATLIAPSSPLPASTVHIKVFVRPVGSDTFREVNLVEKTWNELTSTIRRIYQLSHNKSISISKLEPLIGKVLVVEEDVPFLEAKTSLEFELE